MLTARAKVAQTRAGPVHKPSITGGTVYGRFAGKLPKYCPRLTRRFFEAHSRIGNCAREPVWRGTPLFKGETHVE
jgi:hypothetical protein